MSDSFSRRFQPIHIFILLQRERYVDGLHDSHEIILVQVKSRYTIIAYAACSSHYTDGPDLGVTSVDGDPSSLASCTTTVGTTALPFIFACGADVDLADDAAVAGTVIAGDVDCGALLLGAPAPPLEEGAPAALDPALTR